MDKDFDKGMWAKGYHCGGLPCRAGNTGICGQALTLRNQMHAGGLKDGKLGELLDRVLISSEGKCIYPDQLEVAVQEVEAKLRR